MDNDQEGIISQDTKPKKTRRLINRVQVILFWVLILLLAGSAMGFKIAESIFRDKVEESISLGSFAYPKVDDKGKKVTGFYNIVERIK